MYYYTSDYSKDFNILKTNIDHNGELHCVRVDRFCINPDEKSVVILCGNDSKSQSRAEFYAHLCRNWLANRDNNQNVTTYSIYYPHIQPLFNDSPNVKLDYRGLATQIFEKVLFKGNMRQSVADIRHNLSNVVFFGHSAGGLVMDELMKELKDMLLHMQLSKAEIKSIFDSIVFVAYAPYKITTAPIKAVYVAPIYDSVGSVKLAYRRVANSKGYMASIPFSTYGEYRIRARKYIEFATQYLDAVQDADTTYFVNKNTVIATPNLLYSDGRREEDHNFAGVINYGADNACQTHAGRVTARFLSKTMEYCVSTKRERFSTLDLYKHAVNVDNLTYVETEQQERKL